MLTAHEARSAISQKSKELGLKYDRINAKTMYFDGSPAVAVTLRGFEPNPRVEELEKFARSQKIVLSIYVNGISG